VTGKATFKFDIETTNAGTSREVGLQFGDNWTWCEGGGWGWINSGMTTTVNINLQSLSCGITDFSKLRGIYIWFSGVGTFYTDKVRAE
jgi:hypothetical protein